MLFTGTGNANKILGIPVQTGTPSDTFTLLYDAASNRWIFGPGGTPPAGGVGGGANLTTVGSVPFVTAAGVLGQSGNLFWDNANGRLGVGTNAPQRPAHIRNAGGLRIDTASSGFDLTNTNTDEWQITAVNSISSFGILGSLWTHNNGNVGIGASTPQGKLAIGNYTIIDALDGGSASSDIGNNLRFDGANWRYLNTGAASLLQFTAGDTKIFTAPSGTGGNIATLTERMQITSSGNVGIGTASPDALLTVNTIASFGDGAQTTPSIAHKGDLNTGFWFPAADNIAVSVGGVENFRFNSAGRFQAGGTTGLERINVVGSYQGYGWHNTGAAANEKYWRHMVHDANRSLMIQAVNDAYNAAATPFEIVRNSGTYTTQYVRIAQDGGNVGIGTTSPAYQLQLSTDSAAKPTTNTWTIASDSRLKTVKGEYQKGLAEICQVRPVSYEYNGKAGFIADGKDKVSILAQELMQVFPECVDTFKGKLEEDGPEIDLYNYNGHAVTFALINAIKELKAKIDILEAAQK